MLCEIYFVIVSLHRTRYVVNVASVYVCWVWNILKSNECREAFEHMFSYMRFILLCVIASHKLCSECCIRVCVLILKYLEVYWVSWSVWECYLYMQEAVFLRVCICIYSCVSVVAEHSVLQCMWHLLWTCYGGCRLFSTLCASINLTSPLNLLAAVAKNWKK